jgi:hypothetical protein
MLTTYVLESYRCLFGLVLLVYGFPPPQAVKGLGVELRSAELSRIEILFST